MDSFSSQLIISSLLGLVLAIVIVMGSDRIFVSNGTQHSSQATTEEVTTKNLTFDDDQTNKKEQQLLEKRVNKLQKILGRTQEEVERKLLPDVMRTRSKSKAKKVLGVNDTELAIAKKQGETIRQQLSYATKHAKQLTKVLGIDEREVLDAIRNDSPSSSSSSTTNSGAFWQRGGRNTTSNATMLNEPTNWVKVLDTAIFLVMIAVFCYFVQLSSKGNFGRMLAGIFPREFQTLGLKQYMERV